MMDISILEIDRVRKLFMKRNYFWQPEPATAIIYCIQFTDRFVLQLDFGTGKYSPLLEKQSCVGDFSISCLVRIAAPPLFDGEDHQNHLCPLLETSSYSSRENPSHWDRESSFENRDQ